MFAFTFGEVGSGKSLKQIDTVLKLCRRSLHNNKKKQIPLREVWCNFHINEKYKDKFREIWRYWEVPQEMIFIDYPYNTKKRLNFDCVWDEMAVELPSDKWKDTDPAIRKFFSQHRKRGIEIYGNTQDYMMLDINARRIATNVFRCTKLMGSRDPSATLPPVKYIWGVVLIWELDKNYIRKDDQDQRKLSLLPEFLFITRKLCAAYDTTEDIEAGIKNRLLHLEFECSKCGFIKREHLKV